MGLWIGVVVVLAIMFAMAAMGQRPRGNGDGVELRTDDRQRGGERTLRQRSRGRF